MKRKIKIFIMCICAISIICMAGELINVKATGETKINIGNSSITIDGKEISTNIDSSVYKTTNIEINDDANGNVENTVINITKAGTYRISGTAENTQIAINAGDSDEVIIILDNCNISCSTAPAIVIYNALDNEKEGEAGVTIQLAENSENTIIGSHIPKNSTYTINGESKTYEEKYDGAISSDISLKINGEGKLTVEGDKEGIETKMHLTIDGGNLTINSDDDAINACEDSVSVITINEGTIYANIKAEAEEGDGIDSNGYIYINGGRVYSFASATSQDSGLDSDSGIYINGGTVIGTGNMVDEVSKDSTQQFIFLEFTDKISAGTTICITDENDNPIMAYKTDKNYQTFLYSAPDLDVDSYKVYSGGTIEGEETNGLYTTITSYTKGTEVNYTEASDSKGMGGEMLDEMENIERPSENNSKKIYIGIGLLIIGIISIVITVVYLKKSEKINNK